MEKARDYTKLQRYLVYQLPVRKGNEPQNPEVIKDGTGKVIGVEFEYQLQQWPMGETLL